MIAATHLDPAALDRIAAGARPSAGEAVHVAACETCRFALADRDPAAIFALLSALPGAGDLPDFPRLDLPPRPAAVRPARVRTALAVAAAALAVAAVGLLGRAPAPAPRVARATPPPTSTARAVDSRPADRGDSRQVVTSVDSPTARVMTLVPPGGRGATVTLILDEGFDL